MKKVFLFFALIVAFALAACHGTEEPAGPQQVASIVTFEGTNESGITTFSYIEADGSTVNLTALWTAPADKLTAGSRVLIYYLAEDYGVSAQIQLNAVIPIPTGKAEVVAASDIRPSEPLQQARIWRSGQWLNLASVISFSGDAESIDLLVEASTLSQPTVDAYIVVRAAADSRAAADRQLYASWRIDEILNRPGCEQLSVKFTAPNNELKSIIIKK